MSESRPSEDLVVSVDVKVMSNDMPISVVRLRDFRWRSDHEEALRSTIGHHWTNRGGRKRKVVIQSCSCSPAQLKQAVLTVIMGALAPIEPETPEVVRTVRNHISQARHDEVQESHRLLTLASLMEDGRENASCHPHTVYCADSVMKFNTRSYSWFFEGRSIKETLQKFKTADVSRTSVLSASCEFRRYWLFKDPSAWWLHL